MLASVRRQSQSPKSARTLRGRGYNSGVMPNPCKLAVLAILFAVVPAAAQNGAIEAKQALVIVQHYGSEGEVRVDGVPVLHFASDPILGNGSLTDSLGSFSTFATNGAN